MMDIQLINWTATNAGTPVNGTPATFSSTTTLSSTDTPGHALFIGINSGDLDWRSTQNNNLWQGASGINNPCPTGYRLPTAVELEAERNNGGTGFWGTGSAQNNAAFASPLKLSMAGSRSNRGWLSAAAGIGYYWSSTVSGINACHLFFGNGWSYTVLSPRERAAGLSVRCIKN
jgi:hypothetical protein